MGIGPGSVRTVLGLGLVLCWPCSTAVAGTLSLSDPILAPYSVGARFDANAAGRAGFVMTDTFQLDEGRGTHSYFRYEDATEDATFFVEASVGNDLVHALGWSRTLPKAAADSLGAAWIGAFAGRFGFPTDVVADDPAHAVAWNDEPASLRLELIEQPEEVGSDQWEISAVLRALVKGAK
jgi:hypothetical protein